MQMERPGKPERRATRLIFLFCGMAQSAWAALVPYAKARVHANDQQFGLLLFFGAGSILSMPTMGALNPADTLFKSRSQKVTALVTLDKLETRAPHVIGPLEFVHELVVPHDTPFHLLATLGKAGITVLTAGEPLQPVATGR
jgi:hypothetical protein